MKKLVALTLALMLALCACVANAEETTDDRKEIVMGALTLLNMSEEDYFTLKKARSPRSGTSRNRGRIIAKRMCPPCRRTAGSYSTTLSTPC